MSVKTVLRYMYEIKNIIFSTIYLKLKASFGMRITIIITQKNSYYYE
jgi:hypothetical protein